MRLILKKIIIVYIIRSRLAQLVEHSAVNRKVAGSSPVTRVLYFFITYYKKINIYKKFKIY